MHKRMDGMKMIFFLLQMLIQIEIEIYFRMPFINLLVDNFVILTTHPTHALDEFQNYQLRLSIQ